MGWIALVLLVVGIAGTVWGFHKDRGWTIVVFMGLLIIGIFVGTYWGARKECLTIAKRTGYEVAWDVFGGCFIAVHDGRFVPVDERSIGLILRELTND